VFLCTNRVYILDAAIRRRAAIVEEFRRPNDAERRQLFAADLKSLRLSDSQIATLVSATAATATQPVWTYSDIRTRLYPAALALAFPREALRFDHLKSAVTTLKPSPIMKDS
jgi:AAA+ superfamily predicted ATPase